MTDKPKKVIKPEDYADYGDFIAAKKAAEAVKPKTKVETEK